jgi:glucosyl-3-phosphoglycerate synthase
VITVALVPARDGGATVGATVVALSGMAGVDRVVVVDDGSTDDTSAAASAVGASVVRLAANVGKAGAVAAGLRAVPEADLYLLVDADTGGSAAGAAPLLAPVVSGQADLAIGVLPAGVTGGAGLMRRVAGWGIRRACGFEARAPLSGQRAVRGDLLRSLTLAARFGLETAMTIDAVRAGARVVEIDVDMWHRATGGSFRGLLHRAGQGVDIARALRPRLASGPAAR